MIHLPSSEDKRTVLRWTTSWSCFCISFALIWARWPLSGTDLSFGREIFLFAVVCGALIALATGRSSGSFFDRPAVLTVTTCAIMLGTIIIGLPALGVAISSLLLGAGFVLCGMFGAFVFVLWCEYLAYIGTSRAIFILTLNIFICLLAYWFIDHLDALGSYVASLVCVLGCHAGIRRSWEGLRMTSDMELSHGVPGMAQLKILVALFVYLLCVAVVRTLAAGELANTLFYGSAVAPCLILCFFVFSRQFSLDLLYRLAFPLAIAGAVLAVLPTSTYDVLCVAVADAIFVLLFLLMAAIGIDYARCAGERAWVLAALGCAIEASALLLSSLIVEIVAATMPLGAGFPVVTVCCLIIAACTAIVLVGKNRPQIVLSFHDDDALFKPLAALESDAANHVATDVRVAGSQVVGSQSASSPSDSPTGFSPSEAQACAESLGQRFELRNRECEVLALLLRGHSAGKIAQELFIARGTVKAHINRIYQRMNIHARDDLLELAAQEAARQKAASQETVL